MELFFLFLLIALMAFTLGSGYPVAFSLPGSAILTVSLAALSGYIFAGDVNAYFYQGGPETWLTAGVTNFRGVYWEAERDTLIAIPLFVFMGIMLQRSRIAEDLLVTMAQLFGPVRGGLGMSVVFVGALLAATTGIVGATVVAMGLISLPAMLRNNYSHPLATGTIAASGTLGQIIPPSIVLIILADQLASAADQAGTARSALYKTMTGELTMPSEFDVTSTSAGEMFLGALLPGLVLVGLYILYIAVIAFIRPKIAPTVPYEGKYDAGFALKVFLALVPPLALIFIVLGSIIMGIATVNQAGAIGAAGALVMAGYRLREGQKRQYWPAALSLLSVIVIVTITRINPVNIKNVATSADATALILSIIAVIGLLGGLIWSGIRALRIENTLQGVMVDTAKTTSLVFIILIGAAMLTASFRGFGGEELVREFLTGLPGGFWGQFVTVMLVIFVLGFFLDFIEISVVVVPIVAPILLANPNANVTAVWLGVMIGLNIQTSFLTPPFGFALFYLRGVAPAVVRTISMYKGVIPFICLQLLALVIVAYNPPLVNYLPLRISLTSETAPPPINPKLQYCIEANLLPAYQAEEQNILSALRSARNIDLSALPSKDQKELSDSFGDAEKTFELVAAIAATEQAIAQSEPDYRPLHVEVRNIQQEMTDHEAEISAVQSELRTVSDINVENGLKSRIEALKSRIKELKSSIPENWEQAHKDFTALLQSENRARIAYRRNVDNAYEPVKEMLTVLRATEALAGMRPDITALREFISKNPMPAAVEQASVVLDKLRGIEGTRSIQSELSKVRRALRGHSPNKEDALGALDKTLEVYDEEVRWKQAAASNVLPKLAEYEAAIRPTIGLRQQHRLPDDLAADVAGCLSEHRDLTLYF
ncbi:MAG TPA: TRAP transporter large permease subunit [Hyphomicrobiales bacterium]|nr:TRAP transporter large permease subunit [Hyphomicrobiales bacterium]